MLTGIHNRGDIVGYYSDSYTHGMLRHANGEFESIDVPSSVWTVAKAISNDGRVAGSYQLPGNEGAYGYIRSADGSSFTTFKAPAKNGLGYILPTGINTRGEVVFWNLISLTPFDSAWEMYARYPDGTLTRLRFPGSDRACCGPSTVVYSINDHGRIVGSWWDPVRAETRGFIAEPIESAVPEPGARGPLAAGLITVLALLRARCPPRRRIADGAREMRAALNERCSGG